MNIKYLLLVLSVLLIFFGTVFLIKDKEPLTLTTSPYIYSYKYTTETEYFHVKLLSNDRDSYYVLQESIDKLQLTYNEETIPLLLKEIKVYETETDQFLIDLSLQVAFHSNDYYIDYPQAYLEITYTNNKEVSLYIGEFNFLFKSENTSDLDFMNLSATYQEVDGINTVSGIVIDLVNKSGNNIIIKDIDILSSSTHINNDYIIEVFDPVDSFIDMATFLDQDYSFFDYEKEPLDLFMQAYEQKKLIAPLIYNGDISFIHRFVLIITYIDGTEEKTYIIDDFPYMNTSIFNPEYIDNLVIYEIN